MAKTKVLVVEDDRSLSDALRYNLNHHGYEVLCAFDGQDALNQAFLRLPEIILLDVMLPVLEGIEVCKKLRANSSTRGALIVMLTAKGEESDELVGFSVGADDYVVKPFSVKVLLERIKALRRRQESESASNDGMITSQGIVIDRVKYQVTIDGNPITLTPTEFRLLETIVRQPGRAFDRSELMDTALEENTIVMERTIDVHVRALRKKLGEASKLIETVRGIGYRFRDESS
jgi:two-component system phosphate regulon response regulator PhoB